MGRDEQEEARPALLHILLDCARYPIYRRQAM